MDHSAYERIVPGSHTAVLMMHGILGTPRHFDMLLPLIPEEWSVYNVLLPGHGGSAGDFGRSSMTVWKARVMPLFSELCKTYDRILLVGHSMGTLFAIRMALGKPEKVGFLFLLAAPMMVAPKPKMAANALRMAFGRIREDQPWQTATRDACSVETTLRLWQYLRWIPRFLELFREIHDVRALLAQLKVPCIVLQSGKDELVSHRAAKILENSGRAEVMVLPESGHYYYPEKDRQQILEAFRKLCEEYRQ